MATNHQLIVFSLYISFIPILVDSISFNFPRFPDPSIVHQGDATNVSTGAIEFNNVDSSCRVGLITYVDEVHLWDKGSSKVSDFSTHFSFSIDTLNKSSGEYGHGLTFFIAPSDVQISPNSNGGYLGLFNTSTAYAEDNQMIVVEFDSFSDDEWDPPYEHVGINKGTVESSNYTRWNASEHSGDVADVWVTYNASAKNLMVVWSYRNDANTRANSSVSLGIDLKEAIPDTVSIGFSAATDQFVERNSLQSWEFNSNLKVKVESIIFQLALGVIAPFSFLILGGAIVSYLVK